MSDVVREEAIQICKRHMHMKEFYDTIGKKGYIKMLRNRISALKARIKRKSEERELTILRTRARRLHQMPSPSLIPPHLMDVIKIDEDEVAFYYTEHYRLE